MAAGAMKVAEAECHLSKWPHYIWQWRLDTQQVKTAQFTAAFLLFSLSPSLSGRSAVIVAGHIIRSVWPIIPVHRSSIPLVHKCLSKAHGFLLECSTSSTFRLSDHLTTISLSIRTVILDAARSRSTYNRRVLPAIERCQVGLRVAIFWSALRQTPSATRLLDY